MLVFVASKVSRAGEHQATSLTLHRSSTGVPGHLLGRHTVQQGPLTPCLKTPIQANLRDGAVTTHHQTSNREETQTWLRGFRSPVLREVAQMSREAAKGQQKALEAVA